MSSKPNVVESVAKTLVNMGAGGLAVYATSQGVDPYLSTLSVSTIKGLLEYAIASISARSDHNNLVARIREEGSVHTVETIRDVLIEVMGLKPEFTEPIDELADVVLSQKDGRDEQRFRAALLKLFNVTMQVNGQLSDIKADTSFIPEIYDIAKEDHERLKNIEAALVKPDSINRVENRSALFLESRVESLTTEVRNLLDNEGKDSWDKITDALADHSWQRAFSLANEMEQWLEDNTDKISIELKIQGLLTLADVAILQNSGFPFEAKNELSKANKLLEKAETVATGEISEETANRLLRFRAKLTYLRGDHLKALDILDHIKDPGAISLKIAIMQDEGKWREASDFAHGQPQVHKKWAAQALVSHINAFQNDRALALWNWAKSQETVTKKACALSYVKSYYAIIVGEQKSKNINKLTDEDLRALGEIQKILYEVFVGVFSEGPSVGLDAEALEMAILFGHALQRFEECNKAVNHLEKWKPVSLELGRALLRGDIKELKGLANRYLADYGDVYQTQMLAAMLLVEVEKKADAAIQLLLKLLINANRQQREEVVISILIGAQYSQINVIRDAYQAVVNKIGGQHRLAVMLHSVLLARENAVEEARSLIVPLADDNDHIWLQLAASYALQQSEWLTAAAYLHRISELTGQVESYRKEAETWNRAGKIHECIVALEKAHRLLPNDNNITRNLAAVYHGAHRFPDASRVYEEVWKIEPHTSSLCMNYANTLVLSGNISKAIIILKEYLQNAGDSLELHPLLACVHLMHAQGDAEGAMALLPPKWNKYKTDHKYLMAVLKYGYAANKIQEAHKAFTELASMLNRGALPEGVMWSESIDGIKKHIEVSQERDKYIKEQYREGRLPWLLASSWSQPTNHSYWSWVIRTQPLVFSDSPESVATYSIYSTNSFHGAQAIEHRSLQPIAAAPKGSRIVADMSALITLHRLDVLKLACAYYDKVYLPQIYRAAWVEELARIPHHQPSQFQSRQAILQATEEGLIKVVDGKDITLSMLDEYKDAKSNDTPILRIHQLVKWLIAKGKMSSTIRIKLKALRQQPSLISDANVNDALKAGMILATPLTLQTLHEFGLLEEICLSFQILFLQDDINTIKNELRNQKNYDKTGDWFRNLVSVIESIPNIEFLPLPSNSPDEKQNDEGDLGGDNDMMILYGIGSSVLALKLNLPLLADDRYCQQSLLNHVKDKLDAAFGSDTLIASLQEDGKITVEQHAAYYLKLIRWRYKFLIPSASLLREMAFRFKEGLPGTDLHEMAVYMQDCMRDPGLYGGSEQVEPPMPMALKMFTVWVDTIAKFIVTLWWDERFSEKEAARLTCWASRYFLPSWPSNITQGSWRRVANAQRSAFLGNLVIHLIQKKDVQKAFRVLNRVRRSIGISEEELAFVAESALNSVLAVVSEQDQASKRALFLSVLKLVYGKRRDVPWRLLPMAQQVGVVDLGSLPLVATADYISAIRDTKHQLRMEPICGPFVYIKDGESHATVINMYEAICSSQTDVRKAVLHNLTNGAVCPTSEYTCKIINSAAEDIRSDEVSRWVPAVTKILEPLREDYILNMAGFIQSQQSHYDDGYMKCWPQLIQPTTESLLTIDRDGWTLLPLGVKAENKLSVLCAVSTSVSELLEKYDELATHMTLASPLDLGTQLKELVESANVKDDVWRCTLTWLMDSRRPWRQYHACQALLKNIKQIPENNQEEFWHHIVRITELTCSDQMESDEAQIWRIEAELAANYLRSVELGGYGLEPNRAITTAWWASKSLLQQLVQLINTNEIAPQIRKWREESIFRATLLTRDAWAWISPTLYSSPRFATLFETSPRSVALLVALGDAVENINIQLIPSDIRERLRNCYCSALLLADTTQNTSEPHLWMWDCSLLGAAKKYLSSLPQDEQTEDAIKAIAFVEKLYNSESLKNALEELPNMSEMDAIFVCLRVRMYCCGQSDASEIMSSFLYKSDWRNACASKLSLFSWEILSQALLFLQARPGKKWETELPFIFLRLAETESVDPEKTKLFLITLTMSSLVGNTSGAIKALAKSESINKLRPCLLIVREFLETLRADSRPDIGVRMQSVLTVLDGIC